MDTSRGEGLQQPDKMPEQIRTCKQIQIERCRSDRDRVGQRQKNGVDSTPGIAYRQHLLSSVTHILVSGSQVVPLTQWSLKPAHVWLSLRSESINNQLVSWYLTPSQLLCVHQNEIACNYIKHNLANKKVFPNRNLGFKFESRSVVPAGQTRGYN